MPRRRLFLPSGVSQTAPSDGGATMVEYALLLGLIALVAVGAVVLFGDAVLRLFENAISALPF